VIIVAAVVVYAANVTTLLTSMLVASVILVLIRVLSVQEARKSLNWDLYVTVAGASGIATGLSNAGVVRGFANALVAVGTGVGLGEAGVIAAVYFTNVVVSNVLTSAAAVALLLPVALDAASQVGISSTIMAFTLMLSASASFVYPSANNANLLIYGPGKYKHSDFLRFGVPLQILLWITATAVLSAKSWHVPWIVSWSVFLAAVSLRVVQSVVISSVEPSSHTRP
jgi:di/tricarboxylate transporter